MHNRYRQPGGEDTVLANEAALLRDHGHEVALLEAHNAATDPVGMAARLRLARDTIWSRAGQALMDEALQRHRPDVVHVHNTFTRLSPAVLRTARARGVAVVQTLHNYRLACANGLLLRDGAPCERCLDEGRVQAVRHRCYRGSAAASAVVSLSGAIHLRAGTYRGRGLRVIVLTEFARSLLLRAGLDAAVLRVKPNFVFPPAAIHSGTDAPRDRRVVFVGRLAPEKGLDLLLESWRQVAPQGWTLELIGDGELRTSVAALGASVRWLGWLPPAEVQARMASARFLVMASRWYEGLPMVLLEALSAATPIIVPRLGAMADVVDEGHNGLAFEAGDAASLARVLQQAMAQEPGAWRLLSEGAAATYRRRYAPEVNHQQLVEIYREAMAEAAV